MLLDQDITKRIELGKMEKIKDVMVIRYRGTPLGNSLGECPYPYVCVSFLGGGEEDDGFVDGVGFFLNLCLRTEF